MLRQRIPSFHIPRGIRTHVWTDFVLKQNEQGRAFTCLAYLNKLCQYYYRYCCCHRKSNTGTSFNICFCLISFVLALHMPLCRAPTCGRVLRMLSLLYYFLWYELGACWVCNWSGLHRFSCQLLVVWKRLFCPQRNPETLFWKRLPFHTTMGWFARCDHPCKTLLNRKLGCDIKAMSETLSW